MAKSKVATPWRNVPELNIDFLSNQSFHKPNQPRQPFEQVLGRAELTADGGDIDGGEDQGFGDQSSGTAGKKTDPIRCIGFHIGRLFGTLTFGDDKSDVKV
jgi:hypothetical protein